MIKPYPPKPCHATVNLSATRHHPTPAHGLQVLVGYANPRRHRPIHGAHQASIWRRASTLSRLFRTSSCKMGQRALSCHRRRLEVAASEDLPHSGGPRDPEHRTSVDLRPLHFTSQTNR